ncbi:hypothetical protein LPTSP4_35850 [Leptospira ryugenii]|uniref:Uncharacterized protein n=1 Tax=Leptospira ryugenii TaxID=1917863 RepID=A0A2P2E598_9LEPT|nr:hypothetical protein [Leptospira ryugenii]GBF52047.1 hypothetical protein LPTSP4_35850 [Leptospira ryugenii]
MKKIISSLTILSFFFLQVCSTTKQDKDDPLRNSKKLIGEGHKSLYFQGAVPIAGTSIKFIPPMEEGEIFILGRRVGFAKAEFSKAILKAKESVVVIKEGTKKSWSLADDISEGGDDLTKSIYEHTTKPGLYIMYTSNAKAKKLIGTSFSSGIKTHEKVVNDSIQLRKDWELWAENEFKDPVERDTSPDFKKRMSGYSTTFRDGFDSFVYGYVDIDEIFKTAWEGSYEELKGNKLETLLQESESFRSEHSTSIASAWKETIFNYTSDIKAELKEASQDIESIAEGAGLSLSLLKAFSKTTKALFFDALLKPIGKLSILSIGYIGLNSIVYPAVVVSSTATLGIVSGVYILVETLTIAGKGVVYVIAPTAELGLGAILGSTEVLLGESYNSLKLGGKSSAYLARKTAKYSTKGAAILTETSGRYILAPISLLGQTSSQALVGGGISITGTATGASIATTSLGLSSTTYVGGKTAAVVTGTTGTVASFGTGTGFGIYYLGKSAGVPIGVTLGSGVVLSYEVMAQLSAHSLLAVADCSYLVLSLEGGKWVLYGVKDTSSKAKGLLVGAVVDLNQVRKEGGTVVKVPIDEKEAESIFSRKKKEK